MTWIGRALLGVGLAAAAVLAVSAIAPIAVDGFTVLARPRGL